MSKKYAYSYAVLRYMHDITTGEFVNVGVVVFCPEARFMVAMCRTTSERLRQVFPSLDTHAFRMLMQKVSARFSVLSEQAANQLQLDECTLLTDWVYQVVPLDDSSLRWSALGHGLTAEPSATLEHLFERFVRHHDRQQASVRRDDEKVWRNFSRALEQRNVLRHFLPHTFMAQDDEIQFERAWKNGQWHCLAPVSFDLASEETIRDKAHKWLGQLVSVGAANKDLHLYFLVGEPAEKNLMPAFASALNILQKSDVVVEVFKESDALALSQRLAERVQKHLRSGADSSD